MWDICEDFCLSFNENEFCFMIDVCRFHLHLQLYTIFCNFNSNLPLSSIFVCLYLYICTNFCIFIYFRLLPNICVLDHTRFIHSFLPHQQADLDRRLYLYLQACSILYFSSEACIWYFQFCYVYLLLWLHITFLYWLLAHRPSF